MKNVLTVFQISFASIFFVSFMVKQYTINKNVYVNSEINRYRQFINKLLTRKDIPQAACAVTEELEADWPNGVYVKIEAVIKDQVVPTHMSN